MKRTLLFGIILIALMLAACSQDSVPAQDDAPASGPVDTAAPAPTEEPVSEAGGLEPQTATPAAVHSPALLPTAVISIASRLAQDRSRSNHSV